MAAANRPARADGPTREVLTPGLLRHLFDVEACVSGAGDGAYVDVVAPSDTPGAPADRH